MSSRTTYLNLVLPELYEFVNSWNAPVNQNMEAVDDFCRDLFDSLAGASVTTTWSALRGSLGSLADRLDVSINADGTLDLSASPDLLDVATSAYLGQFTTPVDRLNGTDDKVYDAGTPATGSRFAPSPLNGPTAGYPHGDLEDGIALRSAHFGSSGEQTGSPFEGRSWAPGLVSGGGGTFITAVGIGQIQLNGLTAPAVFNIDGHVFRMREDVVFDYNLLTPTNSFYVWIYVERVEASYGNASFRYGSGIAAKDLRRLQSNSAGQTSGSVFVNAGEDFTTAGPNRVRSGDVLVIDTPASAAGEYVIDTVDSDTQVTIKGVFRADISGAAWRIQDNWHPNIGAVVTSTDASVRPAYVAGRVYIGRVKHSSTLPPLEPVTFSKGAVHDSGWVTNAVFPYTVTHNLGSLPGSVEIWCRVNSTDRAYRPLVRRTIVADLTITGIAPVGGDRKYATLLFPSLYQSATELEVKLELLNSIASPAVPTALFTDVSGVDQLNTAADIRVVVRR